VTLDTFYVNDPGGDAILDESRWETVTRDLRRALAGECSVEALLADRRPRRPGLVRPSTPGPVRVTVDNTLSDTHTVVEVKAPDRVGLLYLVTRALAAEGLDIATAKIATDLDHALDAFYVTDRAGRKVEDPAAQVRVREAIARALAEETAHGAGTV
jgi:[protein-PII] uridylyltransferase